MTRSATSAEVASYGGADFLSSKWSRDGLYDVSAQIWLIERADQAILHAEIDFLEVGRPGVDGITFGYRQGQSGIWAHYPYENRFERLASSIDEFVILWTHNKISV